MAESEDERPWNEATLIVLSAHLPLEVLRYRIDLLPDRAWAKGSPRGKRAGVQPYSGVDFDSRVERSEPATRHLQDLLDRVQPVAGAVRTLADDLAGDDAEPVPVRIWLHVVVSNRAEAIAEVSAHQVQAVADLGTVLGVTINVMATPWAPTEVEPAHAELVVQSATRSPEDLVRDLPIGPDSAWAEGSPSGDGTVHRSSGITFRAVATGDRQDQLQKLLDRVRPGASAVRELAGALDANSGGSAVQVRLHAHARPGEEVGLDITLDQVRALADLGADLVVTADFPHRPGDREADEEWEEGGLRPGRK